MKIWLWSGVSAFFSVILTMAVVWFTRCEKRENNPKRLGFRVEKPQLVGFAFAVVVGLAGFALAWRIGPGWQQAASLCLFWDLLAISVIDQRFEVIPDALNGVIVVVWLCTGLAELAVGGLASQLMASLGEAMVVLVALLALAWAFERLMGRQSMGGGDVKMLSALALHFGMEGVCWIALVASAVAVAWAMVSFGARLWERRGQSGGQQSEGCWTESFAFGPFIAIGTVAVMLVGA